jgi:hypothetical protein
MTKALKSAISMASMAPTVRFEGNVLVIDIPSHKDLPADLRQKMWISRDELQLSIREAMLEEMRERREREMAALQDGSMSDLQFNAADDSVEEEEEDSIDFMDLASMSFTDGEFKDRHFT